MQRPKRALPYDYVVAPAITLAQFLDRATKEFSCTIDTSIGTLEGPRGIVTPRYLERPIAGGQKAWVVLPDIPVTAHILPNVLRRLCDRLKIDRYEFGIVERSGFGAAEESGAGE